MLTFIAFFYPSSPSAGRNRKNTTIIKKAGITPIYYSGGNSNMKESNTHPKKNLIE
jgi:hypothetical protein